MLHLVEVTKTAVTTFVVAVFFIPFESAEEIFFDTSYQRFKRMVILATLQI